MGHIAVVKDLTSTPAGLDDNQASSLYVDPDGLLQVSVVSGGTTPAPASTLTTYEATVTTTAAPLTGTYGKGTQFFADSSNTAPIFIGGSMVTTTGATRGIPIPPGAFYTLPDAVHNLTLVYAVSTIDGQKLVVLGAA